MAFKLGPVGKGVTAQGAAEIVLVLLMAVLNVFFQRGKALVASVTIWAGEQLGKCIWCSWEGKGHCNLKHPSNMVSYHRVPGPHTAVEPLTLHLPSNDGLPFMKETNVTINTQKANN